MNDIYKDLAIAIVTQAIEDWRTCIKRAVNGPTKSKSKDTISSFTELRIFFRSDYGKRLCGHLDLNAENLLSLLEYERVCALKKSA